MTLSLFQQAIIDSLAAAGMGDHVQAHPGRMTIDDLKRLVVRGKSTVCVGCLGIPRIEYTAVGIELQIHWAAYVLALDSIGLPRELAAMAIATDVGRHVVSNVWGREDVDTPDDIRADNLYSGTLEKRAVALWAVTFRQNWRPVASAAGLDDLLRVVAVWDLDTAQDGEPAPTDTIELEGGSE
jgi:hypothetical protein